VQAYYRPSGFQEVEAPRFQDNRHTKVVRLSVLRPAAFTPQEILLVFISVRGHSAAGKITLMKRYNDTTGNRTRGLPACSVVPLSEGENSVCKCNHWEHACGFQTHR